MCVSGYRTPCGTSSVYMYYCRYVRYNVFSSVLLSPITGLSLRNVYYGESSERGSSAPGCHRGMRGSVFIWSRMKVVARVGSPCVAMTLMFCCLHLHVGSRCYDVTRGGVCVFRYFRFTGSFCLSVVCFLRSMNGLSLHALT